MLTFLTRGTGGNATSATTLAITPIGNLAVGTMGVLVVALDNAGSGGATAASPTTITDSVGNTWTRRQNPIYDPGAANAGVEGAIYTAPITTALTTADNITITWAGAVSVPSKGWTLMEVSGDGALSYVTGNVNAGAATGTPTVTTSSIPIGDAVIGFGVAENTNTWAADADTSNGAWAGHQSTGFGTTTAAVSVTSQIKVVTAAGTQTYNPTRTSSDCILGWIQIHETITSGKSELIQVASESPDTFGGSATATFATGATAGNTILLFAAFDKDHGTMTLPAGFTVVETKAGGANNIGGTVAWKTAVGGETSFNVTVTNVASSKHTLAVYEYKNLAAPANASNQANSGDTAVLSIAAPAITPTETDSLVMAFACGDSTSVPVGYSTMRSWSNGFNERYSAGVGGSPFNNLATKKVAGLTSTGTTLTFATATGDQALVFIAAFKESSINIQSGAGSSTGTSTAEGVGSALGTVSGVGSSAGVATAEGAGAAIGTISAVGTAAGTATVTGVSNAAGTSPCKLVQTAKNLGTDAFTGSITATFPRPTTPGNLLFLVCGIDKNAVSVTVPTGFTSIQSNVTNVAGGLLAYKIADGTEADVTVALGSALVSKPTLYVQEWDGFTGTPLDQSNATNSLTATVTSQATGSITLGAANTVAFAVSVVDSCNNGWSGTRTWSDGFTEIAAGSRGSGATVSIARKDFIGASGTNVNPTFSYTGDVDEMATFIVSFVLDGSSFSTEAPVYKEITLVNEFASPNEVTATSGALKLPFVPTTGNLLLLTIATSTTSGAFTLPSGFTALKSYTADAAMGSIVAYKISDGTESTLSFSWTNTGIWSAACLEYGGVKATDFIGYYNRGAATATSITTATAACTATKSMLVAIVCGEGDGRTGSGTGVSQSGVFTNAFTKVSQTSVTAACSSISIGQRLVVGKPSYGTNFSWTGTAIALNSYIVEIASVDGSAAVSTDGEASSGGATLVQQAENEATAAQAAITVTLGAGATAGNVLIFFAGVDKANAVSSVPSGFTQIYHQSANAGGWLGYKVATGGETALTLTMANAAASRPCAWVGEYSGMDTSSMPGSLIGATNVNNSGDLNLVQSIAPGSISTTRTYGFVMAFASADTWANSGWDSGTWNDGLSTIATVGSTTGTTGKAPVHVGGKHTLSGATVNTTLTVTNTADEMVGFVVEFGTTSDGTSNEPTPPTGNVTWKASGAVTATTATGIVCASASGTYSLKVYRTTDNTLITTVGPTATTAASTNHLVKFAITGLTADTQYRCVPNDGTDDLTGHEFYFKTFPAGAADLKFVHWSCSNLATNARHHNLAAKDPDMVVCMGDWHYSDINSTTESNYYPAYVTNYTSANQKDIYKSHPFTRVWDDHDFSGNDSDSTAIGKTQSAATHRKFIPHYTLPDTTNNVAVYHSFVAGRVRFVIMDVRSEKTTTQQISATQLQWVKDEITAAKAAGQIVVLGSPTPWIGTGVNNDSDTWGAESNRAAQRAEIGTHIRGLGMGNSIFLIAGDAHMLAYDDGTNNTYGTGGGPNFKVFHGAGLGRSGSNKGGPYSGGVQTSGTGTEAEGQYGEISIFDDGGDTIGVQWVGRYGTNDLAWKTVNFSLDVLVSVEEAVGTSAGTSTASAVGEAVGGSGDQGAGSSAGVATATGVGASIVGAVGTAAGRSDASATSRGPWFAMGQSAGNLSTTRTEISGLTYAPKTANASYLWAIEDGTNPHFVAINRATAAYAGVWTLQSATATDVECMSSASVAGTPYLYLGDTGDNANGRATFKLFRAPEPTITGSDGTINSGTFETITCEFPAGNVPSHKDVEAMFVDPDTGDIYLVTKRISPVLLYRLAHQASYTGTQTLEYVGVVASGNATFNTISTTVSGNNGYVVDAAISPSGREILLKSYDSIYYWKRQGTETIAECLARAYDTTLNDAYVGGGRTRIRAFHPEQEPQGEAITFDSLGVDLYTCSEYVATEADPSGARNVNPLFYYERLTSAPTTASFQQGTSSYTGCVDTYISSLIPGTNFDTSTSLIADIDYSAYPTISGERQTLIKWDLSSVPAGSVIETAYVEFYINTEGKQFQGHKMLQSWDSATITWTSSGGIETDNVEAGSTPVFVNGTTNATGAMDTYVGFVRVNLPLSLVQDWIDNPSTNYGLMITGGATESTGDGLQLDSSEGATTARHPKIVVAYTDAAAIQSGAGSSAGVGTASGVGASTAESVASSTAIATAAATGASIFSAVGSSNGLAAVSGVGAAIFAGAGSSAGSATATGEFRTFHAATSTVNGTSTAAATLQATAAMAGSSAGTSTAAALSDSAAAIGNSAGTSTANATGASIFAGVGSSAGVGTSNATGASIFSGVGSSSGTITVTAVGASVLACVGSSTATSSANATGASTFAGAGTSTGAATAAATGTSIIAAAGAAAGTSTAAATGASTFAGIGSSAGAATANAIGASTVASVGSSAGTSTALALSDSGAATGTSAGTSTATATGASIFAATGTSAGIAAATGSLRTFNAVAGSSAGTGTAAATGASIFTAAGTSAGIATVSGTFRTFNAGTSTIAGASTAAATGASIFAGAGASAGTSTANATLRATGAFAGSSTGTSTVLALSDSGAATGVSSGTSAATAAGASISAAAGTAAGAATAAGTLRTFNASAGTSTGSATAAATATSSAASTGSSASVATATGVSQAIVPAVGSSAGVGAAPGVGLGIGSGSAVGSAAGTATAVATSAATSAAIATSAGIATVTGAGAAIVAASATSAGVATVAATGAPRFNAVGSSAGIATVAATGRSTAAAVGTAQGTSTAPGVLAGGNGGTATANGSATVTGVGSSTAAAAGSSAGTSTTPGIGSGIISAIGSSSSSSAAAGTGASVAAGTGAVAATATSQASGASTASAIGASVGAGTTAATGASTAASAGTGAGAGTASGNITAIISSSGSSSGVSGVSGSFASIASAVASSSGTSSTAAISNSIAAGTGTVSAMSVVTGVGFRTVAGQPIFVFTGGAVQQGGSRFSGGVFPGNGVAPVWTGSEE